MAGKTRFRVPTLGEMEKADNEEIMTRPRQLFKPDTASKQKDTSSSSKIMAPSSQSPAQSSPPKRMISQKALLSRQPLSSSSGKSKVVPKKAVKGPSDTADTSSGSTSKASGSATASRDVLMTQRVSRVTTNNSTGANLKASSTPTLPMPVADSSSPKKTATNQWTGVTFGSGTSSSPKKTVTNQWTGATFGSGTSSSPKKTVTNQWTGATFGSGTGSRNAGAFNKQTMQPSTSLTVGARGGGMSDHTTQQGQTDASGASSSEQASREQDAVRADVLPTLAKVGKTNSLVVSSRQKGNPILTFIRNIPWEYGNIVPDYIMGQSNCALYLSLRYHQLNPEYIHNRLKQLGRSYELRVLLVQVDIVSTYLRIYQPVAIGKKDPHHLLKDLAKICILADCTLMLAFSAEEAGRYLETYKVFENKAAEAIMERTDDNFGVQLSDFLTRVKSVNKTDCSTLMATFKSLQGVMEASTEDLSLCPGFGPQKAKRLHDVFREPFLVSKKQRGNNK